MCGNSTGLYLSIWERKSTDFWQTVWVWDCTIWPNPLNLSKINTIHTILSKVLSFTVHNNKMFGTFQTLFMPFISKNEQLPQTVVKSIELQGFLCSSVWSWVSVGYVDSINDIYFVNCLQCFVRWFPKAFLFSGDAKAESLAPKTIEC